MSKDEQMYVEKIYIYSGITTAGKELEEKQLNTSKTNSKEKRSNLWLPEGRDIG